MSTKTGDPLVRFDAPRPKHSQNILIFLGDEKVDDIMRSLFMFVEKEYNCSYEDAKMIILKKFLRLRLGRGCRLGAGLGLAWALQGYGDRRLRCLEGSTKEASKAAA
jgi:hypothetical protein